MNTKEFAQYLVSSTYFCKDPVSYRIKIGGKFITTTTRRTSWPKKKEALEALEAHCKKLHKVHYNKVLSDEDYLILLEYLLKNKVVEIVSI